MNLNLTKMALIGLFAFTLPPQLVRAEPPAHSATTRPAPDHAPGRAADKLGALSDEQIEQVMDFMREHSPNRAGALEGLPEGSLPRRRATAFIVARYRALQAIKEDDPRLYDLKVKQLEVEDDLYGILSSARTPAQRQSLRDRVQAGAKQLVDLDLAEREERIARLRDSLQHEEQKLAEDRQQTASLAQAHTEELIRDGVPALRRETLRRGIRQDVQTRREMHPATNPVER